MIPISDIRAWSNVVPWINDEQIEQDLIISRSLVEIFSDDFLSENLVFRGGTALHPEVAFELVKKELIEKM